MQLEQYLESSGTSMEDLRAHAREQAAGAARFELAMTEIARLEGIDVTDDDVEQKYAELSAQYQLSRDLLRQQLPPPAPAPRPEAGPRPGCGGGLRPPQITSLSRTKQAPRRHTHHPA